MQSARFNLTLMAASLGALFMVMTCFSCRFFRQPTIEKNDVLAIKRAEELFALIEDFIAEHDGNFPENKREFKKWRREAAYLPFCDEKKDGYIYKCEFSDQMFELKVFPLKLDITGKQLIIKTKMYGYE